MKMGDLGNRNICSIKIQLSEENGQLNKSMSLFGLCLTSKKLNCPKISDGRKTYNYVYYSTVPIIGTVDCSYILEA